MYHASNAMSVSKPCFHFNKKGDRVGGRGFHNDANCSFVHPGDPEWPESIRVHDPEELWRNHRPRASGWSGPSRPSHDRSRDDRYRNERPRDDGPRDDDWGPPRKRPRPSSPSPARQPRGDGRSYSPSVRQATPARLPSTSGLQTPVRRTSAQASNSPSSDRNGEQASESQRRVSLSSLPPRPPSAVPPSPTTAMPPPPPPAPPANIAPALPVALPPPPPVPVAMPSLPRPSFSAAMQTPAPAIAASPIQFGASTSAPTTAMTIIQSLIGREAPKPDVPVEEQKRRWVDRVETFSRLVRAHKEKKDAEEWLQLRKDLSRSERFSQATGAVETSLEEAVREATTRLQEATVKYDALVQEFVTSDFWPVTRPGSVPDIDEGLRHYYWTLHEGLKRLERKFAEGASGPNVRPRTPEPGADVDMAEGGEESAAPKSSTPGEVDAAVVNSICEKVIAVVAEEIEGRLSTLGGQINKATAESLESLTKDVEKSLQILDKKIVDEIANLGPQTLADAAAITFQLAVKVNQELDPAVRVIEQDLKTIKEHIESSTREERATTDDHLAQVRASIKSEAEKTAATAKNLVDNERSARLQLDATVKDHSSQLEALNALRTENVALKEECSRLEAEMKTLAATTQRLTAEAEESEKKWATQAESIAALQEGLVALQAQAAAPPTLDSIRADVTDAVMAQVRQEMEPILSGLVTKVNTRLSEHSQEISSSVLLKLQPVLKVNEAIYALFKRHELGPAATPPMANGSHHASDGTPP